MPKQIYDHEPQFKAQYRKNIIDNKALSKANKAILIDFFDLLDAEKLSYARKKKLLGHLISSNNKDILSWLNKDLDKVTKEDLIKLKAEVNKQNYAAWTARDYVIVIKKLYQTLSTLDKYKQIEPLYFWLYDKRNKYYSTSINKAKAGLDNDWLNEEEVKSIINAADSLRDRCFFTILATQGLRPEEILTLRRADISQIDNGIQLKVSKGKTGTRTLFIYEGIAINYLNDYMKTLPDSQEYLFDFGIRNAQKILKILGEKTGIKKRLYLYKFRKYSVTKDRILGVSQGALESKYGWVKGTGVISHYDKSISIDYKREMQEKYGIVDIDKPKNVFADKICLRCEEKNGNDKEYCVKCGLKLDITREQLQLMQNRDELANELNSLKEKLSKIEVVENFIKSMPDIKKLIESAAK